VNHRYRTWSIMLCHSSLYWVNVEFSVGVDTQSSIKELGVFLEYLFKIFLLLWV
jgi:hypothetical protein